MNILVDEGLLYFVKCDLMFIIMKVLCFDIIKGIWKMFLVCFLNGFICNGWVCCCIFGFLNDWLLMIIWTIFIITYGLMIV